MPAILVIFKNNQGSLVFGFDTADERDDALADIRWSIENKSVERLMCAGDLVILVRGEDVLYAMTSVIRTEGPSYAASLN